MYLKKIGLLQEKFPVKDQYPFNLEILNSIRELSLKSAVTVFAGENGAGKSTLLEAICRKCGIYIWQGDQRQTFTSNPYEKTLYQAIELEWNDGPVTGSFFSSDIFRHFSKLLDEWAVSNPDLFDYFGGKSLVTQSHGQGIISFFRARYKVKGLYLMDEPETALSPKSLLELVKILKEMGDEGHAQFILATHSPILMACPDAQIYSFDGHKIFEIEYEQTEHYRIYKSFMADYKQYFS